MGLGVEKGHIFTTLKLPLVSGADNKWRDNSWLIESLRHLADHLEQTNPHIHRIGIEMDAGYKIPELKIEYFNQ